MRKLILGILLGLMTFNAIASDVVPTTAPIELYSAERREKVEALAERLVRDVCSVDTIEGAARQVEVLRDCHRLQKLTARAAVCLGVVLSFTPSMISAFTLSANGHWYYLAGCVPAALSLYAGSRWDRKLKKAEGALATLQQYTVLDESSRELERIGEELRYAVYPALKALEKLPPELLSALRSQFSIQTWPNEGNPFGETNLEEDFMRLGLLLGFLVEVLARPENEPWLTHFHSRGKLAEWVEVIEPHLLATATYGVAHARLMNERIAILGPSVDRSKYANQERWACAVGISQFAEMLAWSTISDH